MKIFPPSVYKESDQDQLTTQYLQYYFLSPKMKMFENYYKK